MEEKIVVELIKIYNPIGIILHGSRAGGYATTHSDWDFFVFTRDEILNKRKHDKKTIEGQYLDIMIWQFPIEENDLKNYFVKYCGAAKLVYVSDPLAQEMFIEAQLIHNEGLSLSAEEVALERDDIDKGIERLTDWKDDTSGVFFVRAADLYSQLYNNWWNIQEKRYSISNRKGIEIIKQRDPVFFSLLKKVAGNNTNTEKLEALKELRNIIFTPKL